jgi:Bacteriocin-protection, YdeI or OmpD-Associated/Domain of unknown function (DUF1905)
LTRASIQISMLPMTGYSGVTTDIFEFESEIVKYDFGKYYYTVVYIPAQLIDQLPLGKHPRLRIQANVSGIWFRGALMPDKGRWYLMVSRKILKQIDKQLGQMIKVRFEIDDQEAVEITQELRRFLGQNPELKTKWDALSAGKRRGLAHRISQAKTQATLDKRLVELEEWLWDETI